MRGVRLQRKITMTYYVYENWRAEGHKARIHFSNCPSCNDGVGVHPDASDENGQWLGPFETFQDAFEAAQRTEGQVSACQRCNPH